MLLLGRVERDERGWASFIPIAPFNSQPLPELVEAAAVLLAVDLAAGVALCEDVAGPLEAGRVGPWRFDGGGRRHGRLGDWRLDVGGCLAPVGVRPGVAGAVAAVVVAITATTWTAGAVEAA